MSTTTETLKTVRVYDTLSKQKRVLETLEPCKVSMYVCGVTVYDYTHIGHARVFVFFDVVQKFLRHLGYEVKFVRNHTDVDDKILKRAAERGEEPLALSRHFIEALNEDMGRLGVDRADVEPLVSETIDEIIEMVQTLIDKGFAYASGGDVYYRVEHFDEYGKLSGRKLSDMESGRSGRIDDAEQSLKEHPFDFALWKSAKDEELSWSSPWGQGRPGWHIECSAMSKKYLGDAFDIHGGGQDLIFPHHENEIAQSEACNGHHYANNWMHVAMVNVDNVKMSKSLGNFWTTRDVLALYHPESIRFFMLGTHYRNPINYSNEMLNEATRRIVYLYDAITRVDESLARASVTYTDDVEVTELVGDRTDGIESFYARFEEALSDDFNTSMGLTLLQEMAKAANELTNVKKKPKANKVYTLIELRKRLVDGGRVLGLLQRDPTEALLELRDMAVKTLNLDVDWIESKIEARTQARANKQWADADGIRDELLEQGIEIMDGTDGTSWRIKYEELD